MNAVSRSTIFADYKSVRLLILSRLITNGRRKRRRRKLERKNEQRNEKQLKTILIHFLVKVIRWPETSKV